MISSARTHTTRRAILQSAVAVAVAGAATAHWKPKLGIYCRYSPANIAFAGQQHDVGHGDGLGSGCNPTRNLPGTAPSVTDNHGRVVAPWNCR